MFTKHNHASKTGLVKQIARKLKLAAAVAAVSLGLTSAASAATDVLSITTSRFSTGVVTAHFGVTGEWATATAGDVYNTQFNGYTEAVTKVHTSLGDFEPTGTASAVVRRYKGPNTDILWYRSAPGVNNTSAGTVSAGKTQILDSIEATGFEQAFSANNILVGCDNLFNNSGNLALNDTNIERLDVIFGGGFGADSKKAFALFDRGYAGQHDLVKVAAITGIDLGTGKPTSYGSLLTLAKGTWGNTDVTGPEQYVIVRKDNDIPGDPFHPSVWLDQGLGGVLIPTTDLAGAGTTIYGYSIFPGDVSAPATDWTTYSSTTTEGKGGGLDAIGTVALVYTVPEPASMGLLGLSAGMLLIRRRPQKA